jgi:hypothetical protein
MRNHARPSDEAPRTLQSPSQGAGEILKAGALVAQSNWSSTCETKGVERVG